MAGGRESTVSTLCNVLSLLGDMMLVVCYRSAVVWGQKNGDDIQQPAFIAPLRRSVTAQKDVIQVTQRHHLVSQVSKEVTGI